MYLITSVTLCSFLSSLSPALTIASVKTIAVVVPSPADCAVLRAASFIICIAKFSIGLLRDIELATVTPSFVIVIPDKCSADSIKTVRPLGPRVLLTALEILEIPSISFKRPSLSNAKSFGMYPCWFML